MVWLKHLARSYLTEYGADTQGPAEAAALTLARLTGPVGRIEGCGGSPDSFGPTSSSRVGVRVGVLVGRAINVRGRAGGTRRRSDPSTKQARRSFALAGRWRESPTIS